MKDKIKIQEAIVVEGKYDKIKLSSIFDTLIIVTNGFAIRRDKKTQELIRRCAGQQGIIVFTDSDRAGFLIRGFLKGSVQAGRVKHAYAPQIAGKEARKDAPSKDGFLGVEGIERDLIVKAVLEAAQVRPEEGRQITKQDFYQDGLSGGGGSEELRARLKRALRLPGNLSANGLLQVMNQLYSYEDYKKTIEKLKAGNEIPINPEE